MPYQILIKPIAVKALEKINDPFYSAIKIAIYNLADDPRPHGYKKLQGRDSFRIRVNDYRIIYNIADTVLVVEVINIGHRKDIYP